MTPSQIACLNIEILRKTPENVIISCIYRTWTSGAHNYLDKINGHIIKNQLQEKPFFVVGDLSINSLDYSSNMHVRVFFCFNFWFFKMVYFLLLTDQSE